MSAEVYFDEQHIRGMQLVMQAAGLTETRVPAERLWDPTLPGGTLRWWMDELRDELVITYTPDGSVIDGEEVAAPVRAIGGGA